MKRITFLAFIAIISFFSVEAQNYLGTQKLKEGSLDFLKGVKKLNVVFDYTDLIINGKTEEYFTATREEKWKNNWDNDKIRFYERFVRNANIESTKLLLGNFPDTEYMATVKVLRMIDESHIYVAEVKFTQTNSTNILAVVSIDYKKHTVSTGWTLTRTINKIMDIAGKQFGKLIVKQIKS